jgi:diguanylate cyclase (GGDEF)-like protein/PAS domain S-box-containing protein
MITHLPVTLVASLVDEAIDPVMIIDEHGTIRYANVAMEALSGYTGSELLDRELITLLPESMAEVHQKYVAGYLQRGGSSVVLGRVREFTIRHRDGTAIPVEMKAVDLGVSDRVRYLGAFMIDLRPRKAMEARNAALMERLEQQALRDPLTGLHNRRAFDLEGPNVMARSKRHGTPVAVAIADIDHFKQINDRYGHVAGDQVLREIGAVLVRAARATDFVARIGGEEFGLLLPDATREQAEQVAERIRQQVEAATVYAADGEHIHVTVSIGLSTVDPGGYVDDGMAHADIALYQAKYLGRNRVQLKR